jgi:hypothetical protein
MRQEIPGGIHIAVVNRAAVRARPFTHLFILILHYFNVHGNTFVLFFNQKELCSPQQARE